MNRRNTINTSNTVSDNGDKPTTPKENTNPDPKPKPKSKSKILLIRILGNDLPGLHGPNQTLNNLEFTLKHESKFPETDKLFMINRIADLKLKKQLTCLLDRYNMKYIDIPFNVDKFKKLPIIGSSPAHFKTLPNREKEIILYQHNLFLINNNGSRNEALAYGKKMGYTWIFPLDSNSFLTDYQYKVILDKIHHNPKLEYLIIPQKRLNEARLPNECLLNRQLREKLIVLPNREGQIGFKTTSQYTYNKRIPYGMGPKKELLNAIIRTPGALVWKHLNTDDVMDSGVDSGGDSDSDNPAAKAITQRCLKVKYQVVSSIFRLSPENIDNSMKKNTQLRPMGLYHLVRLLQSQFK